LDGELVKLGEAERGGVLGEQTTGGVAHGLDVEWIRLPLFGGGGLNDTLGHVGAPISVSHAPGGLVHLAGVLP
jgi:hypothetical protein